MAARSASVNFTVPFVVVVVVVAVATAACCLPSAGVPHSPSQLELVPTSAIVCRQSLTRVPSVLPFVVVDTVGGWRGCAATARVHTGVFSGERKTQATNTWPPECVRGFLGSVSDPSVSKTRGRYRCHGLQHGGSRG
uniref:Putative secreted peptide n=1 Tax=Anopheles braziliensis TaxID=58242 RepID=A0A2M3ZTT4_9DIPT